MDTWMSVKLSGNVVHTVRNICINFHKSTRRGFYRHKLLILNIFIKILPFVFCWIFLELLRNSRVLSCFFTYGKYLYYKCHFRRSVIEFWIYKKFLHGRGHVALVTDKSILGNSQDVGYIETFALYIKINVK